MSYQQTTIQAEPSRSSSNMYNQQRAIRDTSQGQTGSFPQSAHPSASNAQQEALMASMMNQLALGIPTTNMTATSGMGTNQLAMAANTQYFVTAEGQLLMAPANMYPQLMAPTQVTDNSYTYPTAMPYMAQAAYPGYVSGYPMIPYTPGRAGYYHDRADHLSKDVPGLENRRGSYSTNESAPSTPFYGPISQQGTKIAVVDRSPFGSTPSPRQLSAQHAEQHVVKPLPYKTIPINVDLDALLGQHPAIPRAVPAVFTPRESMRTLDQSLSNPISGNRNVYIRGLHPNTDDETLAAYAARFGKVETSKAIIDTATGACKG